jgi:hypothetical protein
MSTKPVLTVTRLVRIVSMRTRPFAWCGVARGAAKRVCHYSATALARPDHDNGSSAASQAKAISQLIGSWTEAPAARGATWRRDGRVIRERRRDVQAS